MRSSQLKCKAVYHYLITNFGNFAALDNMVWCDSFHSTHLTELIIVLMIKEHSCEYPG